MRVLLVVNPSATRADAATSRRVVRSLSAVAAVEVEQTRYRGHARELSARARAEGLDAVVAVGGDGTVSEVADGLLSEGPHGDLPRLGMVPGGATNVLARILGMSRRPTEAAEQLAAGLAADRSRPIGVGHLRVLDGDAPRERWFVLNVGLGLDASAIAMVEEGRRQGRRATGARYALATLRAWREADRSTAPLTVVTPVRRVESLSGAIVTNTDPWSYLGPRRLRPTPSASFDLGLDVAAARGLELTATLASISRMLLHRSAPPHESWSAHDQPWVEVRADRPVDLQADGDHLGAVRGVRLTAVPSALRVLLPGDVTPLDRAADVVFTTRL